jgi:hypothetical protein
MVGKPRYRNEAAWKVLKRVLTHPRFTEGLPIRFRCDPSLTAPTIRCNRFALSVWLPLPLAPYIPFLARFVRSLRRKPMVTIVVRAKLDRTPTDETRQKPKACPKPPKPIPSR